MAGAGVLSDGSADRVPRAADLRRVAVAVGPTAAAAGLQLLVFALTARALGPAVFGALAAVYAVAAIATDVAGLGGDQAMVRAAARDPAAFPRAWGNALALVSLSLLPVVAVATLVAAALAPALAAGIVLLLVSGEVTVGRAAAAAELVLVAHGRPVGASLVRLAAVGARAAAAIVVFGLCAGGVRLWAAATCVQSLATAALLLAVVSRRHGRPQGGPDRGVLGFGLLMMLNQLARAVNGNVDRVVLATVLAPAALGVYASASRLQLVGAILNQAATRLTYPRFFRAADAGGLAGLTRRAAGLMALVGLLALALTAAAAQALPLVLGPAYAGLAPLATGLALACPFVALQYPPADALTAAGRQGLRTLLYALAALASAGLLVAGASAAGAAGAVAGFVAAQALLAGALWVAFARCVR